MVMFSSPHLFSMSYSSTKTLSNSYAVRISSVALRCQEMSRRCTT